MPRDLDVFLREHKGKSAGGGGFFLVHGDADLRALIEQELGGNHRTIPLSVDFEGSTIIHNGGE